MRKICLVFLMLCVFNGGLTTLNAQVTDSRLEADNKVVLTPQGFVEKATPHSLGQRLSHDYVSHVSVMQMSKIIEAAYKMRVLAESPDDAVAIHRLETVGKTMLDTLGITGVPRIPLFSVKRDKGIVIKDAILVQYNGYGDFNNKVYGYMQRLSNAVYIELTYKISRNRKIVFYGHITREGLMTGTMAAEIWDRKGLCWKAQCAMDSLFVNKDSMPLSGLLKIGGMDPAGGFYEKHINFPVKVYEDKENNSLN